MQARSHIEGGGLPTPEVAYLSMEIAIDDTLSSYCGGLGVLAGDHLRAAADLSVPILGITLLYRGGYFTQTLTDDGHQLEAPVQWSPEGLLEALDETVTIELDARPVVVRAWRHWIVGVTGHRVPVLFLDTDAPENDERDRSITDQLYSGDRSHRLRQEAVLGLAGAALLDRLGLLGTPTFHMNEGHSSLLVLALLRAARAAGDADATDPAAAVRRRCVFTTHTPVPEGHDHFPVEMVRAILGSDVTIELEAMGVLEGGELNMTVLGMAYAGFINAVSLMHGRVSRPMFPRFSITSITNGVHVGRWVAPSFARLFDLHLPGWRRDNASLRYASAIPHGELDEAHQVAKRVLVDLVFKRTGVNLDPRAFTLGIARRAAKYKRLDLLLSHPEQLGGIAAQAGPLQIVYAGKAHPSDAEGKAAIVRIHRAAGILGDAVVVVYLEDYSIDIAAVLCSGADVWVNTPVRGREASGTSGMKAAMNGVPSLSVLDGWWPEGHIEGVTGWSIGGDVDDSDDAVDSADLYGKLRTVIVPGYYRDPDGFTSIRSAAIALNGSFFSAERMVRQYMVRAYHLGAGGSEGPG